MSEINAGIFAYCATSAFNRCFLSIRPLSNSIFYWQKRGRNLVSQHWTHFSLPNNWGHSSTQPFNNYAAEKTLIALYLHGDSYTSIYLYVLLAWNNKIWSNKYYSVFSIFSCAAVPCTNKHVTHRLHSMGPNTFGVYWTPSTLQYFQEMRILFQYTIIPVIPIKLVNRSMGHI